jgi:APA family basic amino acid/polyamine antiporter
MDHLSKSQTVAADVFKVMFGPIGGNIAALGVMVSTFGATNSNMITGPRIYLAIARDGLVPNWLQQIHPRYQTPANTIVLQAVWTILLVVLFSVWTPGGGAAEAGGGTKQLYAAFDNLTNSVICAGLIFYGLAVAAVYVLRRTRPDMERPYRTWGYPVTPALLLAAYVGAFISLLIEMPAQTITVLLLIGAGIVYYIVARIVIRGRSVA